MHSFLVVFNQTVDIDNSYELLFLIYRRQCDRMSDFSTFFRVESKKTSKCQIFDITEKCFQSSSVLCAL